MAARFLSCPGRAVMAHRSTSLPWGEVWGLSGQRHRLNNYGCSKLALAPAPARLIGSFLSLSHLSLSLSLSLFSLSLPLVLFCFQDQLIPFIFHWNPFLSLPFSYRRAFPLNLSSCLDTFLFSSVSPNSYSAMSLYAIIFFSWLEVPELWKQSEGLWSSE